jgi:hypothetical protein
VAARRGEVADDVRTGVVEPSVTAPTTTVPVPAVPERLLPSYLPPGYAIHRVTAAGPMPQVYLSTTLMQVFGPPGEAGTPPTIVVSATVGVDVLVPPGARDAVAGPWRVKVADGAGGPKAFWDDGERKVGVIAMGADQEQLLAFVAAVRWDPAVDRYAAPANPGGLVEILRHSTPKPAGTVQRNMVVLRRPGAADISIETNIGEGGDPFESVPAGSKRDRRVDVNGRPALLSTQVDRGDKAASLSVVWPDGTVTVLSTHGVPDPADLPEPALPPGEGEGDRVSNDELLAVARSLRTVDQAAWDAAPR